MIYQENILLSKMATRTKVIEYVIDINSNCWNCISHPLDKDGYPKICRNNKETRGNRYVYEREHGEIPKGLVIRHTCDNPTCINPNHLVLGTYKENAEDRVSRDRGAFGERNGTSKLTEDQVFAILKDDREYREIAPDYNVHYSLIGLIKTRKKWKYLQGMAVRVPVSTGK